MSFFAVLIRSDVNKKYTLNKDYTFLKILSRLFKTMGLTGFVVHSIGLFYPFELCKILNIPIWGDLLYKESIFLSMNFFVSLFISGVGIGLFNRQGWWIVNIMLSVKIAVFMAFGVTWTGALMMNDGFMFREIFQSLILNVFFLIFGIALLLYFYTIPIGVLYGFRVVPDEAKPMAEVVNPSE